MVKLKRAAILSVLIGGTVLCGSTVFAQDAESRAKSGKLETRAYRIEGFLFSSGSADQKRSIKEILESQGINFGQRAAAEYERATETLTVTNSPDQLELLELFLGSTIGPCSVRPILITVEFIETEASLYHDWIFNHTIANCGNGLRKQAQEWVKSGKATIVETVIVNGLSGLRAKSESVHEVIYPSEFDPPEIPNDVLLEGPEVKVPVTAGNGTAFDTRNLGVILEVDPVQGADDWTIDLNLAPEIVGQDGFTDWPPKDGDPLFTVSMPKFQTQKVTAQVTLVSGSYNFLGASRPRKATDENRRSPMVLQFVRAYSFTLPDHGEPEKLFERIR